MNETELFWTQVSAIGQVVGAAATFAAVVVSLFLALSERRARLRLTVGESMILGGPEGDLDVVTFSVRNVGMRTVHVRSLGWRTGGWPWQWPKWLQRQYAYQLPGSTGLGIEPPYVLEPGQEVSTYVDRDSFLSYVEEKKGAPLYARKWPILGLRRTRIWGVVSIAAGRSIKAKATRALRDSLFAQEQKAANSDV